jgi:hypothetical protein
MIRIIIGSLGGSGSGFGGLLSVTVIAFLYLTTTTSTFIDAAPPTTKTTARNIKILNESGSKVELYWIHVSSL